MKKLFTLIELIIVIVVIAILAAIVIPNVSSFKEEANISAIKSNVRNIQTASDMYSNKNYGEMPVEIVPTIGSPQYIDYAKIKGKFLRDLPKTKGATYWIDYSGTIYGSTVPLPEVVSKDSSTGTLSWKATPSAKSYTVFEKQGDILKLVAKDIKGLTYSKGNAGDLYVSAEDAYGLDTPAVGEGGTLPVDDPNTAPPNVGGSTLEVGDYVALGNYESEDLLWKVIEKKNDGFILFKFGGIPTNGNELSYGDNDWESSSLRSQLNSTFYNDAFNSEQKTLIKDYTRPYLVREASNSTSGSEEISIEISPNEFFSGNTPVDSLTYDSYYKKDLTDKVALPDVLMARDTILPLYGAYGLSNEDVKEIEVQEYATESNAHTEYESIFVMTLDGPYGAGINTDSYASTTAPIIKLDLSAKAKAGSGTKLNPYNFNSTPYVGKSTKVTTLDDLHFKGTDFPTYDHLAHTLDLDFLPSKFLKGQIEMQVEIVNGDVSVQNHYGNPLFHDDGDGGYYTYYDDDYVGGNVFNFKYNFDSGDTESVMSVVGDPGSEIIIRNIKVSAYY